MINRPYICSALGPWILAPVPVFQDALKGSEGEAGRVTGEITHHFGSFRVWPSSFWGYRIWTQHFFRKRSPQESEEGNESYYDRSLRFNILSVMWLVSNSMFFTAEINGDSLRSLAMIWLCVAHEKRLVSYKFGTYFSCGNRCGLEIMGCNTDAWNDLEILGCSTRSTD